MCKKFNLEYLDFKTVFLFTYLNYCIIIIYLKNKNVLK